MSDLLTKEQFIRVLPKQFKPKVTDELVESINKLIEEPELRDVIRDNLLSYTGILLEGKFKLQNYIDACRYVSYKLMGSGSTEAYAKTFPDRFQRLLDEGSEGSVLSAYAGAYNKNLLVNKILEQTLIPTHILNADVYQKAINVQAHLMMNATSEKVRTDAANSLLNHLKKPETNKIQLDIGYKEDKTLEDLRATTQALVEQQRRLLEEKVIDAKYVAESRIIPREIEDGELVE